MRAFAKAWDKREFVQGVLAQITWYHHIALLEKVADPLQREWYVRKTIDNGWSRNVLVHWIDTGLFDREGRAQTNFTRTLPAPQSELAQQLIKDPYKFDFLGIGQEAKEKELEGALIRHIRDFLLELGVGFAFVGNQYRLEVGTEEFFVDLLFYHLKLRCYVVIELKTDKFRPDHTGQINFYCTAVDENLRHPDDQPTIGLLLVKGRDRLVAEYALRDIHKPIGVADYKLTKALPTELKDALPTIQQLETELDILIDEDAPQQEH